MIVKLNILFISLKVGKKKQFSNKIFRFCRRSSIKNLCFANVDKSTACVALMYLDRLKNKMKALWASHSAVKLYFICVTDGTFVWFYFKFDTTHTFHKQF